MKSTLWWLGLIFGTLSVVMLIKHGFDYGFVAPLRIVLDYYEQATHVLLGWAEPLMRRLFEALRQWVGWELHLYPHWKHLLVLMSIYFSRDAAHSFRLRFTNTGRLKAIWGGAIALSVSILTGTVSLDGEGTINSLLIVAFPVLGILLYDVGTSAWLATVSRERVARLNHSEVETWTQFFWSRVLRTFVWAVVGLAVAFFAMEIAVVQELPSPGLALLGLLIILLGLLRLWHAATAADQLRERGEPWLGAYWRSVEAQVGIATLSTFMGAVLFLVTNAGLKLAGL